MSLEGPTEGTGDLGGIPLLADATLPPPTESEEARWPAAIGGLAGAPIDVDRLTISFPCTMRLSLDFLRSLVSISAWHGSVPRHIELDRRIKYTVTPNLQVNHRAYTDINDPQKPLILFLELLLIKYLYCQYAFFICSPVPDQHRLAQAYAGFHTCQSSRSNKD